MGVRARIATSSGSVKVLLGAALAAAVGEALDTIWVGWPALVFAGLFTVGLVWIVRGGRGGVILVGLLMLVEIVFLPSYERNTTADWVVQAFFLVLGVTAVIAAGAVLWSSRASRSGRVST